MGGDEMRYEVSFIYAQDNDQNFTKIWGGDGVLLLVVIIVIIETNGGGFKYLRGFGG